MKKIKHLSAKEVGAIFQFTEATIRRWASTGKIPANKKNGKWIFTEAELKAWLKTLPNNRKV